MFRIMNYVFLSFIGIDPLLSSSRVFSFLSFLFFFLKTPNINTPIPTPQTNSSVTAILAITIAINVPVEIVTV